jgi:predicted lipoprotein with Yx(FWY)xxD motif
MQNRWLAPAGVAAAALIAAGCGSSGSPSAPASSSNSPSAPASSSSPSAPAHSAAPASTGSALKMATIGGTAVVTNAKGFTLYWFAPDTATTSKCSGSCATIWPPVKGPATAGTGVTGKLATITRSDGSKQATYNGHPLYTFTGDSGPGKNSGNGLNANGGIWHEVTVSGGAAPASGPSSSSSSSSSTGGGGYGY